MPIAPVDPNRVVANRFHAQHFEFRLVHLKRVRGLRHPRGRAVGARAGRAGALVAQILQAVFAVVAVLSRASLY